MSGRNKLFLANLYNDCSWSLDRAKSGSGGSGRAHRNCLWSVSSGYTVSRTGVRSQPWQARSMNHEQSASHSDTHSSRDMLRTDDE